MFVCSVCRVGSSGHSLYNWKEAFWRKKGDHATDCETRRPRLTLRMPIGAPNTVPQNQPQTNPSAPSPTTSTKGGRPEAEGTLATRMQHPSVSGKDNDVEEMFHRPCGFGILIVNPSGKKKIRGAGLVFWYYFSVHMTDIYSISWEGRVLKFVRVASIHPQFLNITSSFAVAFIKLKKLR